jgi:hypothetical protein
MASKKTVRTAQIIFAIFIAVAAIRVLVVMRNRKAANAETPKAAPAPPLNREAYVVPKKLYISNLKSAQQLTKQPVWIKEGYRYPVYPYANHAADVKHSAGMLLPIQKLQIKEVVESGKQVLAVFEQDGKSYAVPIGLQDGSDPTFYADEMFFYEDPHELFNFWTPETWQQIERHEVTKGMNEYQAAFAVGMGTPQPGGDSSQKTVVYPNGGKQIVVTYRNGKAIDVEKT